MKNKAVAMVSPLGYTGLAYYDYSLCQALSEQGIEVDLYTSDRWLLNDYHNRFNLMPLYKGCSGQGSKFNKGLQYLKATVNIFIHIIRSKKRIVHFQILEFPPVDLILILLLKLAHKKIVFTPHDIVPYKNYPLNKQLIKLLYLLSNRIVVHKQANVNTLRKKFGINPKKIIISRHGGYEYFIDSSMTQAEARTRLNLPRDKRILLFFGNIEPRKGVEVLIPGIAQLSCKLDNIYLVIAGRLSGGLTKGELETQVQNNNLQNITLIRDQFIPDKEVSYYYYASDIVILPYTEIYESGVLRYAQTCGRAVICSHLEEFHDTVKEGITGAFFRVGDSKDLAQVAYTLFHDYDLKKLGKNAQHLMNTTYRWHEIGQLTISLYENLVKTT